MELKVFIKEVLIQFQLASLNGKFERIGKGHINQTFRIGDDYVLQRINTHVFRQPEIIAENLRLAANHLKVIAPDYLFLEPISTPQGLTVVYDSRGNAWRLFPYVKNAASKNEVSTSSEAFEVARAFGELTRLLSTANVSQFQETIPQFHNLSKRYHEFEVAVRAAATDRQRLAEDVCNGYWRHQELVSQYNQLIGSGQLRLRVMHNDTKVNNALFDDSTGKVKCVVDLDTLMPGYFIYDLGDMIRTMASKATEEEVDLNKITIRKDIIKAIYEGYFSEMGGVLTEEEKKVAMLAGPIMIYMIGIRFLTDYLSGDKYFHTSFPHQNLQRATNQLRLLEKLNADHSY